MRKNTFAPPGEIITLPQTPSWIVPERTGAENGREEKGRKEGKGKRRKGRGRG